MKRSNSAGFRLRKFYTDYLAFPIRYGILFAVVISPLGLVRTWAGSEASFSLGGDPIPFLDALAKVPTLAALTFVVTVIMFSVLRVRF
jgi:hypothetical protein